MSESSGIIRITVAAICCVGIILYAGYDRLFATHTPTAKKEINTVIPFENNTQEYTFTESEKEPQETVTESTDDTAESVPTATAGEVLGKVSERFISPYTANTSYNSVYLKNSSGLDIDIKSLLSSPLAYKIEKNSDVQVLIMHTHTTESFLHESRDYYTSADSSRTTDENYNMIRLGNIVAEKLNNAGIKTVHDTTLHDYPEYNGSYDRSAETVKGYLAKYPNIKIVIDMHRDAIGGDDSEKVKPVVEINGKKAAQVMLVMGSQSGSVKNHPNWQENLKLAVRLQQQLETMYPTLARSLSLMSRCYNQNLTTGSILIEMGTDANSIDEVCYSAELVGNALVKLLNTLQ